MQIFVNGIIAGLTIAVLALAFTVVYLPTRVFHVALGGVYTAVPFFAWAGLQRGWSWYVVVAAARLAGVGCSVACELTNDALLERRRASSGAHLVYSLGIDIIYGYAVVIGCGYVT